MQTISIENWHHYTALERAFYEKQSYESLLSYMAANHISNTEEYFKEYQGTIKTYYELCRLLEDEVIIPEVGNDKVQWEVSFLERIIKIREKAD